MCRLLLLVVWVCVGSTVFGQLVYKLTIPQHDKVDVPTTSDISLCVNDLVFLDTLLDVSNSIDYSLEWEDEAQNTINKLFQVQDEVQVLKFRLTYNKVCTLTGQVSVQLDDDCEPSNIFPNSSYTIEVYPNPVKDQMVIEISENVDHATFWLVNTFGKTVYNKSIEISSTGQVLIPVSKLNPGVYFLRVYANNFRVTKKLIKE